MSTGWPEGWPVELCRKDVCTSGGTIMIKKLQALVFWCKDHQMHGVDLVAAEFDQAALNEAMEGKRVHKEAKETELAPSIKDLEKFNPDKFEMCQDVFLNVLSQLIGV